MEPLTDSETAALRAEEKMGFFIHLTAQVLVNVMLATINLLRSPDQLWFYWPLGGWGIGIALHAWRVFSSPNITRIKKRLIERELTRQARSEDRVDISQKHQAS